MNNHKISRIDGDHIDLYDFYGHLLGRKPTKREWEDFQRHRQKVDLSTEASCLLLVSLAHHSRQREMMAVAMPGVAQKAARLALKGMRPIIVTELRRLEKRLWLWLAGFFIITLAFAWVFR